MPELSDWKQSFTNGAKNFRKLQDRKIAGMGLQNVMSGKSMTAADVTKFTANPYTQIGITKLRQNKTISKLRNKISNSRAVALLDKMGVSELFNFSGDAENPIERIWMLVDENGEQAVPFNVYLSMNVKNESKVVSAPVENGSFVTYNKATSPIQITASLAITGKPDEIKSALSIIMDMVGDTSIVSLVTPDYEYKSLCIASCNYRRSADNGIDMLIVDCSLIEVREIELQTTNAKIAQKKSRGLQQSKPKSMAAYMRDSSPAQKIKGLFS